VGCPTGTCAQLSFTGNTGIFNNYNGLDVALQNQVPKLAQIVCPPSTACAGTTVETLDASVRVAKPLNNTLHLGGAAEIGEVGAGSTNSVTGVVGKPTVEGVYLGDGCQTANCSDQVDTPSHVHSDKPLTGYDISPPPKLPALSDSVTILGLAYSNYAACSGPGACNSSGAAVGGGGGNDFFISHAMRITSTTQYDPPYQYTGSWGLAPQNLLPLLSSGGSGGWTDSTPNFSFRFTCGGAGVTCDDANGNRVNGHICTAGGDCTASKADGYQVEWDSVTGAVSVYKCPTGQSPGCGVPTPTAIAPGNIPKNTNFRYRVTYVNSGGNEFAISPVVNVTTPNSVGGVTFSTPAGTPPSGTASQNLYRFYSGDNKYHLVGAFTGGTVTDTFAASSAGIGSQPLMTASGVSLQEGLLSSSSLPTNPVLIYVDDRLKICDGCNSSSGPISFRGSAIFLAKGNALDTPTSSNRSISMDSDLLPACSEAGGFTRPCTAANGAFPFRNLFRFYTPGNVFLGTSSQRTYFLEVFSGGLWSTFKQTNLLGVVTAQLFDMGPQVPSFWEVDLPRTLTAFPPTAKRWSVRTARWKVCTPADGTPCI
jgi:hypothetical protein